MGGIKDRFKKGLRSAGEGLSNAVVGDPIDRAKRQGQNERVHDAYNKAFEEGRIKRAKAEGRAAGYRRGRSSGIGGALMAGVNGLEDGMYAANNIIGFPVEDHRIARRSKSGGERRRRKRSHKRQNNSYDSFSLF